MSLTTCTDYIDAIKKRKTERVHNFYVYKIRGWHWWRNGASGALLLKDEKEYIQKKRQ